MNQEQHELYENARKRVKQKKRLYVHFVIFVVTAFVLIVLTKVFKTEEPLIKDWLVWAIILLWLFFWVLHFVKVFVTNKFMDKNWERSQTDKLVLKQEIKIAKLEKEIAHEAQLKAESEQYATELKKKEKTQNNLDEI